MDERPAVFLVGRRIHDHVGATVGDARAPVATEAGILGSGL
jgi:hypothetical protein